MIRGIITYYPDANRDPVSVVIGVAEDVKAPRELAALEKAGWVIDDSFRATYKAFLAGRRSGVIGKDEQFTTWIDIVQDVDLRPSRRQVEQAVALGQMDAADAERLLALLEAESGEATPPPD